MAWRKKTLKSIFYNSIYFHKQHLLFQLIMKRSKSHWNFIVVHCSALQFEYSTDWKSLGYSHYGKSVCEPPASQRERQSKWRWVYDKEHEREREREMSKNCWHVFHHILVNFWRKKAVTLSFSLSLSTFFSLLGKSNTSINRPLFLPLSFSLTHS